MQNNSMFRSSFLSCRSIIQTDATQRIASKWFRFHVSCVCYVSVLFAQEHVKRAHVICKEGESRMHNKWQPPQSPVEQTELRGKNNTSNNKTAIVVIRLLWGKGCLTDRRCGLFRKQQLYRHRRIDFSRNRKPGNFSHEMPTCKIVWPHRQNLRYICAVEKCKCLRRLL